MMSVSYYSPRILNPNPPPDSVTLVWGGAAYCYSGANKLFEKVGVQSHGYMGWINETIGDVDNDTKPDFLITVPFDTVNSSHGVGSAYIYSGGNPSNPSLLYRVVGQGGNFGYSAKTVGDINNDQKPDFIIGTLGDATFNRAYVFSGGSGLLIYTLLNFLYNENFGFSVGSADVNGDGKKDFIVGAPSFPCGDPPFDNRTGKTYVVNGTDGSTLLLNPKSGVSVCDWFGHSVAGIGDVDTDGKEDFIVGAPLANPGGRNNAGSAYVYSGGKDSLLYTINGDSTDDKLGWAVAGIGDANGDGKNDFMVSARYTNAQGGFNEAGSVFVFSVINGSLTLLQRINATTNIQFGSAVGGAGDVNGDGEKDFIVGASFAQPGGLSEAGSAFVYVSCISAIKGDADGVGGLTPGDAVLMLECIFLGQGNCPLCVSDMDCNGSLAPADAVFTLNKTFLGIPAPCEP